MSACCVWLKSSIVRSDRTLGLKNASFVGLAIPLSILLGVLVLDLTGTTMNVVVLFSLILALGLLVDNGIVVIENIYRYMQDGYSSSEAARLGTGEVAVPIIQTKFIMDQ